MLNFNKPTLIFMISLIFVLNKSESKLVWKVKPEPFQIANEHDDVRINCEFEDQDKSLGQSNQYFVIWYKDGSSQNVLALNEKLANVNSSNYEIIGKYNLVIKNVSKSNSGLYTCQLFQSNDLISSVNLTVLVPPKHAKISFKQTITTSPYQLVNKGYLVENDRVDLECCTNSDANPEPIFEWHRLDHSSRTLIDAGLYLNKSYVSSDKLCNVLRLNLTRYDNNYSYKCMVTNDALKNQTPIDASISLTVEYKPEVTVHLASNPSIINRLNLIENSSVTLYCNTSAQPRDVTYQWYFGDNALKNEQKQILQLNNLTKQYSGSYWCKSANRHGYAISAFKIEILYIQVSALNKTLGYIESSKLRQSDAVYINTFENSSLALECQIDSNPTNENKVVWYYYQLSTDSQIINKVILSNWISGSHKVMSNNTHKLFVSQLSLNNVTSNHSGYYSCAIQTKLTDDLKQTLNINSNSTYFLQVQYSPIVKVIRKKIYANNYDQVELSCEVKSNPQSMFSWYLGPKELVSNYKYNITNTVYQQIQRANLDDLDNVHFYRSTLIVNSLTQFDFGDYYCRANNIIGENGHSIKLKRKQKPEVPIDFKIVETTSNSVRLSWLSGSNGGENSTYLITVNNQYNLTTLTDEDDLISNVESENRYNLIEIRGLQSYQTFDFKLLAFNSMGSSDYTDKIKTTTLKTSLKAEHLPGVLNAQFNELREAICFELENLVDKKNTLRDLTIKIDVLLSNDVFSNSNSTKFNHSKSSAKSYLLNLSKLKFGQNCIPFSQLIELDWQLRNSSTFAQRHQLGKSRSNVFTINSALILNEPQANSKSIRLETLGRTFYEFKKLHNVNLSICYSNDSSICSVKANVKDYSPDISTYITLIAIGCSAILIFIVLLIASLCCCCCRRRSKDAQQQKGIRKTDLNSKLVIKSFPIVSNNQQGSYDYSDASCKSSQQHILNGSGTHSSGSSTYSRTNEKNFYQNEQNLFDANMPNKYAPNTYKIEFSQNVSSIATVESDASSSTSLENKTISTSNGKSSSSHSPYTVTSEGQQNSYFSSIGSYPQKLNTQSFVYSGGNQFYIKGYQHQQTRNGNHLNLNTENLESGYSTPSTNISSNVNMTKKLVYEVIV